ncbi:lipopolysaccharide biosynthesis protein [Flagellimonas sp. GZD32]|uniref:lipopolysaccharide biosynthesis protein n=1 Tax=Flagellimonas cixiensis TaxID=3228750 RepID=UPI0035C93E10
MSIQKELKKGFAITFVSKYSNIFFELIISFILARLLTPEEFGIVALLLVFITFFNIIGEIGIGAAIIQNKKLTDYHIQTIFNYSLIIAVLSATIFFFSSHFIANFYENQDYTNIGKILSSVIFFYILNVVPQALLRRGKQFLKLEGSILFVNVITGILAIYLAYKGQGYYSLIYREIIKSALLFFLNFYLSKFRLGQSFNRDGIRMIFGYSAYQFLFNFINYFSRNLDNILIGKFMGANSLGLYDRAYRLMLYPVQSLTFVITPVLHPVLAEYQHKPYIIHDNYKGILELLSFIGIPLSIFLYVSAEEIILVFYGEQWTNSVGVFKILALTIWIQMTLSSTGAIFQALGKTNLLFVSGLISALFTLTGIAYGIYQGSLEMVGYGILVAYCFNYFQVFYLLFVKGFKKPLFQYLIFFKSGFVAGLALIILVICIEQFEDIANIYLRLVVKGILLVMAYLLGAFLVKKEYIRLLLKKGR